MAVDYVSDNVSRFSSLLYRVISYAIACRNHAWEHASVKRDLQELNNLFTLRSLHTRQTRAEAHSCGSHLSKHILKTDINIGRPVCAVILSYEVTITIPKM